MEGRPRRTKTTMKGPGGGGSRRSREQGEGKHGAELGEQTGSGTSKNALRERTRVESLRRAYLELQAAIPSVPPNTKLSKLDVLVLATTYISHLSQLLQEDDARAGHDPNNNTTTTTKTTLPCTPSVVPHGAEIGSVHGGVAGSGGRPHQKGLLHPVKKWPMRARLYAGVGATEAATLLTKHTPQRHHHHHHSTHSTLPYTPRHPSQPPLPRQQQQQEHINHPNTTPGHHKTQAAEFPGVESLVSDFSFVGEATMDKTYSNSSWLMPQIYQGGYMESWETDGAWGPGMTYADPSSCYTACQLSQPYTSQAGCWEAWEDGVA